MTAFIERLAETIRRWRRFIAYDIWRIGRPSEEAPDGFVIKLIRVAILLVQNFIQDKLLLRAAALTFVTLLSIVPALALMWFVIDKFNLGEILYEFVETNTYWLANESETETINRDEQLWANFLSMLFRGFEELEADAAAGPEAPVHQITEFARKSTDTGALGVVGGFFVLATVIGLIRNIESAFNSIWGMKNTRSWYRMFSDYVMVIILLPVVVAFALTVTTILESGRLAEDLGRFAFVLRSTQYILIWLGFTALYYVVPNTHVKARYALLGGVTAGTLWLLMSYLYVKLQFGIGRFDVMYSNFSVIPLLIMWIYLSWVIMLFGAELTYAYQNEKTFAMERWAAGASFAYREAVGLRAMIEIGRRFDAGEPGLAVVDSAEKWHVPSRLLNETLEQLEDAGLVRQCATEPVTFVPARSLDKICVGEVVAALREAGRDPSDLREDEALKPLLTDVAGARNRTMREPLADWVLRLHPTMQAFPANDDRIIELNETSAKNDASG